MNEPIIYSTIEIEAMLTAPKFLGEVDWETPELQLPQVRETPGEKADKFVSFPVDLSSPMSFTVEPRYSTANGAFSITLAGKIGDSPWQALCRYDLHPSPHTNKRFCDGGEIVILEGSIHRHIYNEKSLIRTGKWHKCAELLFAPQQVRPSERRERLKRSFLEGANIKLVGKDAYKKLMEFDRQ